MDEQDIQIKFSCLLIMSLIFSGQEVKAIEAMVLRTWSFCPCHSLLHGMHFAGFTSLSTPW